MDKARLDLYRELSEEIGNTPLYRISKIEIPRGNSVFVKEENKNPGGSHYDRVFVRLFQRYENQGRIAPGETPVVETTSGSAGVSFARLGRLLGYECLVVCPEDLPLGRLRAIQEEGAQLRLTPAGQYVDGSAEELGRIFRVENKKRKAEGKPPYFGLNHSQTPLSAEPMENVVDEAVEQAFREYRIKFDLIIAAGGNGTTLLGFGRAAKRYRIPFVVWEPLTSGLYMDMRFPDQPVCIEVEIDGKKVMTPAYYETLEKVHFLDSTIESRTMRRAFQSPFKYKYGLEPGALRSEHRVYGTVYGPTPFPLPNVDTAFKEGLVDNVRILSDKTTKHKALGMVLPGSFQYSNIERLASWEPALQLLKEVEGKPVGWSSAGNLAMILDDNWRVRDSNILTFFYDDLSRYE